jgi:hypothetical protein
MIQRIQSIYLLLAVLACIGFIFISFGQMKPPDNTILYIKNVAPLWIATAIVAAISFLSIFLFKNRKTQMKAVLINIVLSVVLIGLFLFGLTQHVKIRNWNFGLGAILPVFILAFNCLAYGSIKHDEELVRSMDRLR